MLWWYIFDEVQIASSKFFILNFDKIYNILYNKGAETEGESR